MTRCDGQMWPVSTLVVMTVLPCPIQCYGPWLFRQMPSTGAYTLLYHCIRECCRSGQKRLRCTKHIVRCTWPVRPDFVVSTLNEKWFHCCGCICSMEIELSVVLVDVVVIKYLIRGEPVEMLSIQPEMTIIIKCTSSGMFHVTRHERSS